MSVARVYRILCIEDEPDLRRDMVDELREHGFLVDDACNGEDALATFLERRPDLILCDIQMPLMSGTEFRARLLDVEPGASRIPFIFTTAFGQPFRNAAENEVGHAGFMTKPIDYDELISLVRAKLGLTG